MSGDRSSSSSDYRKDKKRPKDVGKFLRIRLGGRTQIGEGRRKRHDLESCMCLLPALSVRLGRSLLRGMRGKGIFSGLDDRSEGSASLLRAITRC